MAVVNYLKANWMCLAIGAVIGYAVAKRGSVSV